MDQISRSLACLAYHVALAQKSPAADHIRRAVAHVPAPEELLPMVVK